MDLAEHVRRRALDAAEPIEDRLRAVDRRPEKTPDQTAGQLGPGPANTPRCLISTILLAFFGLKKRTVRRAVEADGDGLARPSAAACRRAGPRPLLATAALVGVRDGVRRGRHAAETGQAEQRSGRHHAGEAQLPPALAGRAPGARRPSRRGCRAARHGARGGTRGARARSRCRNRSYPLYRSEPRFPYSGFRIRLLDEGAEPRQAPGAAPPRRCSCAGRAASAIWRAVRSAPYRSAISSRSRGSSRPTAAAIARRSTERSSNGSSASTLRHRRDGLGQRLPPVVLVDGAPRDADQPRGRVALAGVVRGPVPQRPLDRRRRDVLGLGAVAEPVRGVRVDAPHGLLRVRERVLAGHQQQSTGGNSAGSNGAIAPSAFRCGFSSRALANAAAAPAGSCTAPDAYQSRKSVGACSQRAGVGRAGAHRIAGVDVRAGQRLPRARAPRHAVGGAPGVGDRRSTGFVSLAADASSIARLAVQRVAAQRRQHDRERHQHAAADGPGRQAPAARRGDDRAAEQQRRDDHGRRLPVGVDGRLGDDHREAAERRRRQRLAPGAHTRRERRERRPAAPAARRRCRARRASRSTASARSRCRTRGRCGRRRRP